MNSRKMKSFLMNSYKKVTEKKKNSIDGKLLFKVGFYQSYLINECSVCLSVRPSVQQIFFFLEALGQKNYKET